MRLLDDNVKSMRCAVYNVGVEDGVMAVTLCIAIDCSWVLNQVKPTGPRPGAIAIRWLSMTLMRGGVDSQVLLPKQLTDAPATAAWRLGTNGGLTIAARKQRHAEPVGVGGSGSNTKQEALLGRNGKFTKDDGPH